MPGRLFTDYFLRDGIKATDEWKSLVNDPNAFAKFRDGVRHNYEVFGCYVDPNEAVTEQELIRPVLEMLGWVDYLPQQGTSLRVDVPDHLLFDNGTSKQGAAGEANSEKRFRHALVVEESKRFAPTLLDHETDDASSVRTPHDQMIHYLQTADRVTGGILRWGILTQW